MIKLMIIDDEPIFREHLCSTVNWESYGFRVCADAGDGVEALEIIRREVPDIALVDINMPFMDGLSLAEKLADKYPQVKVVIVTGHDEFEYAKKAVKLGVKDYILKPFDNEELISTLIKIKEQIQKGRQEHSALEKNKSIIKENLFNRLIQKNTGYGKKEILESLGYFNINLKSQIFQVAAIEIDRLAEKCARQEDASIWKFAVGNMVEEIIRVEGNHFVFEGPEDRIVSIVEFEDYDERLRFDRDSYLRLSRLTKKYFDFTVTIGVGQVYSGVENIRKSYEESLHALKDKFISGCGKLYDNNSSKGTSNLFNVGFNTVDTYDMITFNLKSGNWSNVEKSIKDTFKRIKSARSSSDHALVVCSGLVSLCLSYIGGLGKKVEDVFGKDFAPYSEIKSRDSAESLEDWVLELFKKAIECSIPEKNIRSVKVVESAKQHIHDSYYDSGLTVEDVAKALYINSRYLRKLFKDVTGMTVVEYITNIRMQKAKQLLSEGNIKHSEIAIMTGYKDAGYFSRCFKKHFGMSPSKYEGFR